MDSCIEDPEAAFGICGSEVPVRDARDPAPLKHTTRRLAFLAGRLAPHYGPIRASSASRLEDGLCAVTWWACDPFLIVHVDTRLMRRSSNKWLSPADPLGIGDSGRNEGEGDRSPSSRE